MLNKNFTDMSVQQLTLGFSGKPQFYFDNFLKTPANRSGVEYLRQFSRAGEAEPYLYVYGHKGSGKSHLLQACCHAASQQQIPAIYLPLAIVQKYAPSILENLEHYRLIAIDDVQCIAGNPEWEEALFHLFNRIMAAKQRLLISGNRVAQQLPIKLADLASRLNSGISIGLVLLTEPEMVTVIQQRANEVGLVLSKAVMNFLLKRLQRDMSTLSEVLSTLDQASLTAQHKVTIPFIKQVLNL